VKNYVDGYITITPEAATNNIKDAHTFTVKVTQVPGSATPVATSADVSALVTPAPGSLITTCDNDVPFTGNIATCTITINNNTPGVFTASATSTFAIGGVLLTRGTDATGLNSGSGTKTYVAGALKITKVVPDLTGILNYTSINKTFTVNVKGPSYPGAGHDINFTVLNGVLQTPTSVTLDPIIPGAYTITEVDAGAEWTEVVTGGAPATVVASQPATEVTVTNTYTPGSLELKKIVGLNGYIFPNTVDLDFTINVTGPSYPAPHAVVINVANGLPTNSPQILSNLIPGEYTVTEVDPGIAWSVSGNGNVTVSSGNQASKTITNNLLIPKTTINMTADTWETTPGGNVTLTITDTNDGQVPISNPSVALFGNNVLTNPQPTYVSGDANSNSIMDIGETWTWTVTLVISANTTFTVNGIGTDPLGNLVNGGVGAGFYPSETFTKEVKVIGTTRTLGFWQTHTNFTTMVYNSFINSTSSNPLFIGVNVWPTAGTHKGKITATSTPGASQLFGGFYAPIAKKTDGSKRTPVDQARIQMLQQLLAAKLNCAAFGCSGATQTLIANADAAYSAVTPNKNTIISLAGQLDAFNNSGDANAIPPSLGVTGKATPSTSKLIANMAFWDLP
jgi:hypothetical protein